LPAEVLPVEVANDLTAAVDRLLNPGGKAGAPQVRDASGAPGRASP
jgi:hypothetical protein